MKIMKKLLCALGAVALACTAAFGDVAINSTNFPDATFRNYVTTNFDKDSNGTLSDTEISEAQTINIQGSGTINLSGIEKLTALKRLYCNFSLGSAGNHSFDYTSFKSAYGLNCDIDDSYLLLMHIEMDNHYGLMTPMIGDVKDTTAANYLLKLPLYNNQTLDSISFRTKGTTAIEVNVAP